jgi:hypothetical protein
MEIKLQELRRIIKEELANVLDEKKGKKRKAAKKKKRKKKKKAKKKDACYNKVKSRYDVWPSAYASGALVKCRKVGAANWGNSKKNESLNEEFETHDMYDPETGKKYVAKVEADHTAMAEKGYTHVDPKKIEKILRDEGGAAGMDPFLKEFGNDMEEEVLKTLSAMPSVAKHEDGDYILDDDKNVDLQETENCGCGMNPCKTYGSR